MVGPDRQRLPRRGQTTLSERTARLNRFILATLFPHPFDYDGDLVDLIADIVHVEAARRLLLIGNAVEFFGFE
ncbi:hypothetical protein [Paraburkholderia sp. RL17-373-BIF-A]|uniref:hypothetical protein n=1 Tax=Paraburkholderia sp. RL17-373-BIF-A TaxID=3031629 RepID=UPI0038BA6162